MSSGAQNRERAVFGSTIGKIATRTALINSSGDEFRRARYLNRWFSAGAANAAARDRL